MHLSKQGFHESTIPPLQILGFLWDDRCQLRQGEGAVAECTLSLI